MATTQPLGIPLDLPQAAHLLLHQWVTVSGPPGDDLWITDSQARPIDQVLKEAVDPQADTQAHVVREQVMFVHWMPVDNGPWPSYLICRRQGGGDEVVSASGRFALSPKRDYRWDRAISWNKRIVVPTDSGVDVISLEPRLIESYVDLAGSPTTSQPSTRPSAADSRPSSGWDDGLPQALLDNRGVLAWMPAAGTGAARFIDEKWTRLGPDQGWPAWIVHLVPLLDGSVLQISLTSNASIQLALATLDATSVDEKQIAALVDGLSDPDQAKRSAAYDQLTRYGPGIWPVLEKLNGDQPPEAQARLQQLLHNRVQPTLGGMSLLGNKTLRIAERLADGGAIFYAPQGVSIPDPDGGDARERAPAWISIRPGRVVELLPEALTADLTPGKSHLFAFGNEWVANFDADGPKRFIGNGFVNLLRKDETRFSELIGIDHRGRWVFRPGNSTDLETLIVDPTIPDPIPRLPAWALPDAETVGWDKDNWPVVKHGAAYALMEKDWRLLDVDKGEKMNTSVEATSATTQSSEMPILIAPDGSRYFGGLIDLHVHNPAGKTIIWPLPPIANGKGPVTLIRTSDGRLYLFNEPGRVLRIAATSAMPDPFEIEATFTENIPNVDHPTRIWLDPAGRIDIAWENHLAVLFPQGFIPPELVEKIH